MMNLNHATLQKGARKKHPTVTGSPIKRGCPHLRAALFLLR
jgi:hypothetical protein